MHPRELEAIMGRQLRRLPAPHAPETLLPRVMAAVQAWARRPWYARTWFTWPALLQIGSIAIFVVLAGTVTLTWPEVRAAAAAVLAKPAAPMMSVVMGAVHATASMSQIVRALWRAVIEPFVPYLFA